jgi:hypothetical protein
MDETLKSGHSEMQEPDISIWNRLKELKEPAGDKN